MAICPDCGTLNNDNSRYCMACGSELPVMPPAQPVQPVQAAQPVTQPIQPAQPVAAPVYQPAQAAQPVAAPVYQPAQAAQPAAQPVYQPVQQAAPGQKPMIPVVQTTPSSPVPPLTENDVNAVYMQPEYLKTYSDTPRQGANKYCKTGFALAIIGIFCMGLTCPVSIVYCIIGFFDARKKQEEGKILAIPGFVISTFILFCIIVTAIAQPSVYTEFFELWKTVFNR